MLFEKDIVLKLLINYLMHKYNSYLLKLKHNLTENGNKICKGTCIYQTVSL